MDVVSLVSVQDRQRLAAILADRSRSQKHAARARIILHSAERLDVAAVARRAGISRPAVWRWQLRYAEAGVDGLLRDRTRKPGKPRTAEAVVQRVVALTCSRPRRARRRIGRDGRWPRQLGSALRSVQRIWAAHQLQPHRIRTFKRSRDPDFVAKLADIVGLYLAPPPPCRGALGRPEEPDPGPRPDPAGSAAQAGQGRDHDHDYVRHGTTTLFAALNVLDGTVLGRCMQRHRHQEFIRFLNAIEAAVPAGKLVHVILDNYATHKHPKVMAWLERHKRWSTSTTPRPQVPGSTRSRPSSRP